MRAPWGEVRGFCWGAPGVRQVRDRARLVKWGSAGQNSGHRGNRRSQNGKGIKLSLGTDEARQKKAWGRDGTSSVNPAGGICGKKNRTRTRQLLGGDNHFFRLEVGVRLESTSSDSKKKEKPVHSPGPVKRAVKDRGSCSALRDQEGEKRIEKSAEKTEGVAQKVRIKGSGSRKKGSRFKRIIKQTLKKFGTRRIWE